MKEIHTLIAGWVREGKLPSAVIDIRMSNQLKYQAAFGKAALSTIYDAASLTKVAVALPSIMLLMQRSMLALTDSVQKHIPEFRHPEVTIEHCLRHESGLPGSLPGFKERYTTRDVRAEIFAQELQFTPGSRMLYSDVGMILIGWIVERVSGMSLDQFAKEELWKPLGLKDCCFNPPEAQRQAIAPTEWDGNRFLQGEVHDETAYRLGGVSGSAGLFATASDLADYAQLWLYPERFGLLSRETIDLCTKHPVHERGICWQVQDLTESTLSCGKSWPLGSFGHTGFTGTSLWIDPSRELTVVFMTNAVHLGRDNVIRELRPVLHDAIFEAIQTN